MRKEMAANKMTLKSIHIPWKLGKYGIGIEETFEPGNVTVKTVGVDFSGIDQMLVFQFNSVAALKFFNFNFEEQNYGDFEIITVLGKVFDKSGQSNSLYINFWKETGICDNPYFYEVVDTPWFEERIIFHNLKDKGFKHYLMEGYDSYLEILAGEYKVKTE